MNLSVASAPSDIAVNANASSPSVRKLFGTDGVRGVANTELSPQLALALGAAAASVLREGHSRERIEVVVGRDPRLSGDLLGAALMAGLLSQGVDVVEVGVVPTPGVAHATRSRHAAAGVVLSASHNPMQDNGIKFFGPNGKKLPDAVEARIEAALSDWEALPRPSGAGVGRLTRLSEPVEAYADFLRDTLQGTRLEGWKLVVDCANGAAAYLSKPLLESLGATVILLAADPDGVNINDGCGSLHPQSVAARVLEEGADGGFAFDGDADRVIFADERGRVFDGDRTLCTLGVYLKLQGTLANNVVVGTIMSNLGLEQALARHGIRLVRAPVGDRYVSEHMAAEGAVVGGEKSGHILLPELSTTGDGLLTALQVLRLCRESGRSLGEWGDEMVELPQKLVSIRVLERDGWDRAPAVAAALSRAEERLADRGRLVVRPSGTEKMIRVMAEGPDADEVEELVNAVADAIREDRGLEGKKV